jgi:metaxin
MSSHEPLTTNRHSNGRPLPPTSKPSAAQSSWFALPPPLKYLFSRFPLLTLPSSPLPLRTAPHRNQHTLYIFTSHTDAARNAPSFNPTCLKWQTYLKILGVEFRTVGSNNHACPTGALPFLIPAKGDKGTEEERRKGVVESEKLVKWCEEKGLKREETGSARFDAYLALVNWRIRRAWVGSLFISVYVCGQETYWEK